MDFKHLHQFVVLAETLNFRQAAQKLHMTQPPLSVSIQRLEAEVGAALFVRGRSGVKLTPSAQAALAEARRALFHAGRFKEAAQGALTGTHGRLRVGFAGTATHAVLPQMLPAFRSLYPDVQLTLREATSMRLMQLLDEDALDVGLVRVPVAASAHASLLSLQTETFVLALPGAHRLAARADIRLSELSEEPFVMYTAAEGGGLRMAAIHACQSCGFTPRIAQEAVQVQTVCSLVEAGMGVALVPSVSRRFGRENVVYKTLTDLPETTKIGISLAWNQQTESAAIRNFVTLANETFCRHRLS